MKNLLHKIMSLPVMYDAMQYFFGVNKKKKLLRNLIKFSEKPEIVLDIGGGTGIYKDIWPEKFHYICLDYDLQKLYGYTEKYPDGLKVCSDATRLCFKSNAVDYVFCSSMSHHIREDLLDSMLHEMQRVLRPGGSLIFIDAVSIPESRLNRFLWSLDRGEYPHTSEVLTQMIGKYFQIQKADKFSIYYDYVLFKAIKSG